MSQPKTLTNIEKAKFLRESRKRLGFTQETMASRLNLDKTYLSQLENARREVDDWYVRRAAELEMEIEKSKEVKVLEMREEPPPYHTMPTREACINYLNRFLEECDDTTKLAWTFIELQQHFPLGKWGAGKQALSGSVTVITKEGRVQQEHKDLRGVSSTVAERAKAARAAAEEAAGLNRPAGSRTSPKAASPTENTDEPSDPTDQESNPPSVPAKQAPK